MRAAALALGLALLLGGCLGGSGGDPPATGSPTESSSSAPPTGPPPPGPAPPVVDLLLGFALEDCRGVAVRQPVPVADAQALLPEGFEARRLAGTGYGQAEVRLYSCGNLTASNARVPATFYGQVSVAIEPPHERVPGAPAAQHSEYAFRLLAGSDVLAALWPAAGYDTRSGPASLEVAGTPGPLDLGTRTAEAAVGDQYRLSAAAVLPGGLDAALEGTFARYTVLADGSVLVWTGTYEFPGGWGGQGSFDVPADDPLAGVEAPTGQGGLSAAVHETGAMTGMDLRRVFTPP